MAIVTVWYPVLMTVWFERLDKRADSRISAMSRVSLVIFLTDGEFSVRRKAFEEMLVREWSIESLSFFEAVQRYVDCVFGSILVALRASSGLCTKR